MLNCCQQEPPNCHPCLFQAMAALQQACWQAWGTMQAWGAGGRERRRRCVAARCSPELRPQRRWLLLVLGHLQQAVGVQPALAVLRRGAAAGLLLSHRAAFRLVFVVGGTLFQAGARTLPAQLHGAGWRPAAARPFCSAPYPLLGHYQCVAEHRWKWGQARAGAV